MVISIILIIVGFGLLIKGADFLIEGACNIAKRFKIPEFVMGLTIISIGTSMPEFCVSLKSAISGHTDMAIGNIVGSNLTNLLLILGLATMIRPISFKKETKFFENPFTIFITILFMILCNLGNRLSRVDGIILLSLCGVFIYYTFYMAKKEQKDTTKGNKSKSKKVTVDLFFIAIGVLALKFGADLVVNNSVIIANNFGISEKIIGVTILAIGTSLPELTTSIWASIKKKSDIAIGNILGACTFNILLNMGVTSVISPLAYNISYNKDMIILILATVILSIFPLIPAKNKMTRMNGCLYFIIYILYMITLLKV